MKYKTSIHISPRELFDIGIPSNLPRNKYEDSGYTYRFRRHKDIIKDLLVKKFVNDISYQVQFNDFGIELIGTINIRENI